MQTPLHQRSLTLAMFASARLPALSLAMLCVHCDRYPVSRPRGLCRRCFYTPKVRAAHPSKTKRYTGRVPKDMPEPTHALPGSAEKLAVLEERMRLGQQLWHPDDPTAEASTGFLAGVHLGPAVIELPDEFLRAIGAKESHLCDAC